MLELGSNLEFFFKNGFLVPMRVDLRFNFFLKGIIFSDTVNSATPLSLKACYFNLKIYHQPKKKSYKTWLSNTYNSNKACTQSLC